MLYKLLKYDLLGTWKKFSALIAATLAAIILFQLLRQSGTADAERENFFFAGTLLILCAALLTTVIFSVEHYYSNLFTQEGCLTMTLPAGANQIVLSKVLISLMWLNLLTALCLIPCVSFFREYIERNYPFAFHQPFLKMIGPLLLCFNIIAAAALLLLLLSVTLVRISRKGVRITPVKAGFCILSLVLLFHFAGKSIACLVQTDIFFHIFFFYRYRGEISFNPFFKYMALQDSFYLNISEILCYVLAACALYIACTELLEKACDIA